MTHDTHTALAERAAHHANGDAAKADNLKALADLETELAPEKWTPRGLAS
jgi:hypothetical protein